MMGKHLKRRDEKSSEQKEEFEERGSFLPQTQQNYSRSSAGAPDQIQKFKEQNITLTKKLMDAEEEINVINNLLKKSMPVFDGEN